VSFDGAVTLATDQRLVRWATIAVIALGLSGGAVSCLAGPEGGPFVGFLVASLAVGFRAVYATKAKRGGRLFADERGIFLSG
jgi:hypothetical protein